MRDIIFVQQTIEAAVRVGREREEERGKKLKTEAEKQY